MSPSVPGIHHVTAVATDPRRNLQFYTETLGLRLVKRSVNQDDVSVYHLFYGDRSGSPGTSMTFFPYPDAAPGRVGTGQASAVAFLISSESVEYWRERLADAGVDVAGPEDRFGDPVLSVRDPDGLPIELVGVADAPTGDPPDGPVPDEHAIRGFFGVTLSVAATAGTAELLGEMGYEETESAPDAGAGGAVRRRFEVGGDLGYVVDLCERPQAPRGRPGAGTVHHVAFRTTAEDQPTWRDALAERGLRPTAVVDRKWFRSVYVREHAGILFEFATEGPGYAVDEAEDELGERLVLPEWLEDRREEIEDGLPPLTAEPGVE